MTGRPSCLLRLLAALTISSGIVFCQDAPSIENVTVPGSSKQPYSKGGSLREVIAVEVDGLESLLTAAAAAGKKPVLFLNGQEMKKIYGVVNGAPPPAGTGTLHFVLERNADNQDAWKGLLGHPTFAPRQIVLSVGIEGGLPVRTDWTDFQLTVLHLSWFVAWAIAFIVLVALFFYAAKHSSLLRETGPVPPGTQAALSLARCQMAWWFFLILAAFIFIYMVMWDYDTITAGTLALMGISAGTALAGAVVDTGTQSTLANEKDQLSAELNGTPPPSADRARQIQARIAEIDKQLATPLHTVWWQDLLTDANGLSFHRFQIFVWTLVLGVIFALSVYDDLVTPNFSATLLGLMGISSGTYIGFKFPEQKN